jgi:hypothetical protein
VNFSVGTLVAGMLFGIIGVGYFMYGKRAERPVALVCGAVLAIFPWFVTNLTVLIVIGVMLLAAPFVVAWWFGF